MVLSGLPFMPTSELGFPQWLILLTACLPYSEDGAVHSSKIHQTSNRNSLNTETQHTIYIRLQMGQQKIFTKCETSSNAGTKIMITLHNIFY
jgi:hypothetical protein